MNVISGTFSGTGTSAEFSTAKASVSLVFAGTASVSVQRSLDDSGTWATVSDAKTASEEFEIDSARSCTWRLNCTSHTDNVTYKVVY